MRFWITNTHPTTVTLAAHARRGLSIPIIPRVELRMRNKKLTTPMCANGVSFRGPCGSQRLCQVWKVVIEKVDDRNAERIMGTEILDRFVIISLPTDVPVIS